MHTYTSIYPLDGCAYYAAPPLCIHILSWAVSNKECTHMSNDQKQPSLERSRPYISVSTRPAWPTPATAPQRHTAPRWPLLRFYFEPTSSTFLFQYIGWSCLQYMHAHCIFTRSTMQTFTAL